VHSTVSTEGVGTTTSDEEWRFRKGDERIKRKSKRKDGNDYKVE